MEPTQPAYLLASDTHTSLNYGSQEKGFLESSFDLVSKGIPSALIAAGNELSNIPATIGNFFAGEGTYKTTDNRARIASIDSNLARYYDDHELGIDTAGFIVSSFVPGMAGTKVLRAGQVVMKTAVAEGRFGALTGSALGLKTPMRDQYLEKAIASITDTGNVFKLTETNLLKTFAAGFGQNALEGAAWTAAVNATMNQSPILNDRDASDLTWDIATGAVLGGVVGGLLSGAVATYSVKKAATAAEQEVLPWTVKGLGGTPVESMSVGNKIVYKLQQLEAIPQVDPTAALANRMSGVAQKTTDTLQREIRSLIGELSAGDQALANQAMRVIESNQLGPNISNFLESMKISRVNVGSKYEVLESRAFNVVRRELSALDESSASAKELSKYKIAYVNLRNLEVSANRPVVTNLADDADLVVSGAGVRVGATNYPQKPMADMAVTTDHLAAEARYAWAEKLPKLDHTETHIIGENDIPMLQKAIRDGAPNVTAGTVGMNSIDQLNQYVKSKQAEIAAALLKTDISKQEIGKIVNASPDVLFGAMDNPNLWNLRDHARATYGVAMKVDPNTVPTYMKITSSGERLTGTNGNLLEGMAILAQKEKLYETQAQLLAARILGEDFASAAGLRNKAIGSTSGATLVAAEGGNYGSQSSFWADVGKRTHLAIQRFKQITTDTFTPTLQRMAVDTDSAIEFSVLDETMRNLPNGYRLSDHGLNLVFGKAPILEDLAEGATKKEIAAAQRAYDKQLEVYTKQRLENEAAGIPSVIPLKSPLVQRLVSDHIAANDKRREALQAIHSNNGYADRFESGVYYPIPRNPRDTPHFAFVIDATVSGRGHSKMIYAKDASTLESMTRNIMSDPELMEKGIKVLNKVESEEYYKSIGQYEFERTLSENYINNALARSGKSASFLPLTDPQRIVTNFLDWHLSKDSALVRTTVEHRYAKDLETLRQYAAPSIEAAKSRFGYVSPLSYAENTVDNPAANLIKMALDVSKVDEYPLWTAANRFLDGAFSAVADKVSKTFGKATSTAHLAEINTALKSAGYQDVIVDAALYDAINGTVPRGKLSALTSQGNSILSAFALRSDPFNAINNAVGSSMLLGTETAAVIRAIGTGNSEAVGALTAIAKIKVPGTTDDYILSPTKLIANRIRMFHSDIEGREWFRKNGFISSITDQYSQTLDHIGIALANGDNTMMQKALVSAKGLGDAAEKWSANKLAEEFQRYVAAGVMKDITDIAVNAGKLDANVALSYINTFVNRTQGNYLASQRPVIFSGPLGQAMGLFQTYQFNLLQQVFRHVGEGSKKDLLVMAGLQGGIYGMNGLPAFNAINTHIIGTASGNQEHRNLYDAVFSGAGKEAGEWLLYGGLSNGLSLFHPDLKTNIYTRGDINPRNVTLLPIDPSKTPIYQATERMFSNIKDGLSQVAMGADVWGTFLRGVEQNGISRPLAGMAQMLEAAGRADKKVISTNQQGNMLMAHDLYSLTSLMRIAGAKPLDEAIVNDAMFRVNSYRSNDAAKRKQLAEGIRTSILNGTTPTEDQVNEFAYAYAKTGGKQDEFASFMANQYTATSVSRAEQLRRNISNPYSNSMQLIMGGE